MSSCLSGAGRAYRFESLDLDIIKSPSTFSWNSNSSSPSSTLSESSNSPNSISTRKPRTPRKRPNQTYNEAAAILSTAYPKLFPAKQLSKFTNNHPFLFELSPPDLLLPFQVRDDNGSRFLQHLQRPNFVIESNRFNFTSFEKACHSPGEINSQGRVTCEGCTDDDFDAESMLDEEIGEGIDSILGNLGTENEETHHSDSNSDSKATQLKFCYGYPVGCLGFDYGYGIRRELRAFRNVDEGDWWRFPCVNVVDITPKPDRTPSPPTANKKQKKVEKGAKTNAPSSSREDNENENEILNSNSNSIPSAQAQPSKQPLTGLLLKLNYDGVLDAWSDKASPFSGDDSPTATGNDVQVRLAQIDLFSDNGGIREASVQRYKEKRRTRLFSNSKKIRYQVRKVNADRRPRMKGRFVRTPNAPDD